MEFLNNIVNQSEYAVLVAFILGLMTAISPCPLATNITAIGYISKDLENKKRVFISGLIYTLGRAISYTALGVILYFGASQFQVQKLFQGWGEKILGPLLIIIGVFMLDFIKLPSLNIGGNMGEKSGKSYWSSLLLGMVFALAFCPYSGVLYFMGLIPLTIASPEGLFLPVIFAIATGLPVIIFAWLIAFALGNVGKVYNKIKVFEKWFRRIIAGLFIAVGIYYVVMFFV
ncbi:MAG: sulfite exporter TauE/SafE family protein [Bacteroidales bacterium]|nr:sulfite exporter TauE/SafE family protein [Bacteroidales bacterium]